MDSSHDNSVQHERGKHLHESAAWLRSQREALEAAVNGGTTRDITELAGALSCGDAGTRSPRGLLSC